MNPPALPAQLALLALEAATMGEGNIGHYLLADRLYDTRSDCADAIAALPHPLSLLAERRGATLILRAVSIAANPALAAYAPLGGPLKVLTARGPGWTSRTSVLATGGGAHVSVVLGDLATMLEYYQLTPHPSWGLGPIENERVPLPPLPPDLVHAHSCHIHFTGGRGDTLTTILPYDAEGTSPDA